MLHRVQWSFVQWHKSRAISGQRMARPRSHIGSILVNRHVLIGMACHRWRQAPRFESWAPTTFQGRRRTCLSRLCSAQCSAWAGGRKLWRMCHAVCLQFSAPYSWHLDISLAKQAGCKRRAGCTESCLFFYHHSGAQLLCMRCFRDQCLATIKIQVNQSCKILPTI